MDINVLFLDDIFSEASERPLIPSSLPSTMPGWMPLKRSLQCQNHRR